MSKNVGKKYNVVQKKCFSSISFDKNTGWNSVFPAECLRWKIEVFLLNIRTSFENWRVVKKKSLASNDPMDTLNPVLTTLTKLFWQKARNFLLNHRYCWKKLYVSSEKYFSSKCSYRNINCSFDDPAKSWSAEGWNHLDAKLKKTKRLNTFQESSFSWK